VQLRVLIDGFGPQFGIHYEWGEAANAAAARFDFVALAPAPLARAASADHA
jgi:hypothetical protein